MKKILTLLIALLLIPNLSFAVISAGWNATSTTSGVIAPTRINGTEQIVQSDSYRATSTNATSTFSGGLSVLGNSSLSTTTNTTSSANTGIVAWGDSLTEGQGLGRFSYPSELQKLLGRPVYNRGASGETSTQIKNRFLEATNDFDMPVIFWVGTNDRFTSNASTTVIANLNLMIAQLASSTRYIILGPVSNSTETAGSAYNNTVIDINTWLSTTYGTHYLDVWQMLKDNNNGSGQDLTDVANNVTPSSLRDDATHLNQRGYALVASYIRSNASWLQLGTPDGSVINQYALNNTLDSPNFLGLINQPSGFFRNLSVNASTTNTSDFRDWQFLNITNTAQPKLSANQVKPILCMKFQ
jgi:lysophospholipase L1-like esterase